MARAFEVISVLLLAIFCIGLLSAYVWRYVHGILRREAKQDEMDRRLNDL